jgi:nitrogen fixation NifU-like protein
MIDSELYQELILDHYRRPKNYGPMASFTHHAQGTNPLCGDALSLFLQVEQQHITAIQFEGTGCAICMASASLMTQAVKSKTKAQALALFEKFQILVTQGSTFNDDPEMERLQILASVQAFPMRVKCATLAWHALKAALAKQQVISTE